VNPKYLSDASVTTSAGAGDVGKYVRANASGNVDITLIPTNLTVIPVGSGVAGEDLSAGNLVYIKTSDSKLYKAHYGSIETATVVGIMTGAALTGVTGYYQENGSIYTTTGLTANVTYYLSTTSGAMTTTVPAMNSSSVIPVKIGVASSTTKIALNFQRLQRRVNIGPTVMSGASPVTTTSTIGFPVERIELDSYIVYTSGTNFFLQSTGRYDVIAASQNSIGTGGTGTGKIASLINTGCSISGVASINGSNNMEIVWTWTGTDGNTFLGTAYESL
jgi:hypothetical protein